jgi:hypothetical protein
LLLLLLLLLRWASCTALPYSTRSTCRLSPCV